MLLKALAASIATDCAGCCPTPATGPVTHRRPASPARRGSQGIDRTVAFSQVWDWTADDIFSHLGRHTVPINPVYNKLRELGAPAFLQRVSPIIDANSLGYGRVVWLRHGWPDLYEQPQAVLRRMGEFI